MLCVDSGSSVPGLGIYSLRIAQASIVWPTELKGTSLISARKNVVPFTCPHSLLEILYPEFISSDYTL